MANHPIHDLRDRLQAARLESIEDLAAHGGSMPPDILGKIALLNAALGAVRDEIAMRDVKVGGGGEQPLA